MSGYDRVSRAFDLLAGGSPGWDSIQTTPIGAPEAMDEVRLGKDSSGYLHLIITSTSNHAQEDPRLGSTFPSNWETLISQDGSEIGVLDITCIDKSYLPTFQSLIGELLDRIAGSGRPAIIEFFEVVQAWRRTIQGAGKELTRSVEVGLFGELSVLLEMARLRPNDALEAWRSTENYRHDFNLENSVEVKTFTGSGRPRVEIHGARQLDPAPNGSLTLVAIHAEETASGQTLDDLIAEIAVIIPRHLIEARLAEDYVPGGKTLRRFGIIETTIYFVGDDFPGIRESQLPAHALLGVDDLKYKLLLDVCPDPMQVELSDVLKEL